MSEENNEAQGEQPVAVADQPNYVTAESLQASLDGLRDSLFSTVRKMNSDQKPTPKETQKAPTKAQEPSSEVAQLRRELNVSKALDGLNITGPQKAMLEALALHEDPEDLATWAQSKVAVFGSPEASQESQTLPESQAPNVPAPASHAAGQPSDDVTKWSQEEYDRQFHINAPVPSNKYDIRNRPYYREIRQRAEAEMQRTSVNIGPPKTR